MFLSFGIVEYTIPICQKTWFFEHAQGLMFLTAPKFFFCLEFLGFGIVEYTIPICQKTWFFEHAQELMFLTFSYSFLLL